MNSERELAGSANATTTTAATAAEWFACGLSNLSNDNISRPDYWTTSPAVEHAVPYTATVQAVFFFMAFLWNLYILVGYCIRPQLLQEETANIFFLNLSISDFLYSFLILFNFIASAEGGFLLGDNDVSRCAACEVLGLFLILLVTSTVHTLAILSVDRFLQFHRPVTYSKHVSWKKAVLVVVAIWCVSLIFALLPLFGFGSYGFTSVLLSCQPMWSGYSAKGIRNVYFSLFIAVEALVPLGLILIFNLLTYRIICKSLKSQMRRRTTYLESSTSVGVAKRTHFGQQKRVLYLFIALLVVNTINWTPVLVILAIFLVFGSAGVPVGLFLFGWLCYLLNPVVHPVVELCFIKGLRELIICRDRERYCCYKKRKKATMVVHFEERRREPPLLRRSFSDCAVRHNNAITRMQSISSHCSEREPDAEVLCNAYSGRRQRRRWTFPFSSEEDSEVVRKMSAEVIPRVIVRRCTHDVVLL